MSTRVRVILALKFTGRVMTATQLHELLGCESVSLGSLAGVLHKMTGAGVLKREDGFGPRGGYGYTLAEPDRWAGPKTAWTFILDDGP